MGFSRQEYWRGLPFPSPGDLPNPGIEPGSPALQADSLLSEPPEKPTGELHGPILRIRFSYRVLECRHFGGITLISWDFPGGSDSKESACNAEDPGSIPGLGRSPGEGNGNPLQSSCLENSTDRKAWQDIIHGVAKSRND